VCRLHGFRERRMGFAHPAVWTPFDGASHRPPSTASTGALSILNRSQMIRTLRVPLRSRNHAGFPNGPAGDRQQEAVILRVNPAILEAPGASTEPASVNTTCTHSEWRRWPSCGHGMPRRERHSGCQIAPSLSPGVPKTCGREVALRTNLDRPQCDRLGAPSRLRLDPADAPQGRGRRSLRGRGATPATAPEAAAVAGVRWLTAADATGYLGFPTRKALYAAPQ